MPKKKIDEQGKSGAMKAAEKKKHQKTGKLETIKGTV